MEGHDGHPSREARRPARYHGGGSAAEYDFCLPAEHAVANLLPEVRGAVLTLFTAEQIRWHRGVGNGPGNHLLSSQVQCANALGGMLSDPARVQRAFGGHLDIAEVLPIEDDRFVTFEYVDETDVLGEGRGGRRLRGAQSTSVDAAFLYRTSTGSHSSWRSSSGSTPRRSKTTPHNQETRATTRRGRSGTAPTTTPPPGRSAPN